MSSPTGTVVIMRGLPGVGTENFIKEFTPKEPHKCTVLSSYDYFKDTEFDKTKLQEAHKWNFERFKEAIDSNCPLIVVNNTNIKRYHYYQYIDWAQSHGYKVAVVIVPHNDVSDRELSERSGVAQYIISKMRRDFEWPI